MGVPTGPQIISSDVMSLGGYITYQLTHLWFGPSAREVTRSVAANRS
jgi:hypothetical protein